MEGRYATAAHPLAACDNEVMAHLVEEKDKLAAPKTKEDGGGILAAACARRRALWQRKETVEEERGKYLTYRSRHFQRCWRGALGGRTAAARRSGLLKDGRESSRAAFVTGGT